MLVLPVFPRFTLCWTWTVVILALTVMAFLYINTTRSLFRLLPIWGLFCIFLLSLASFFFFSLLFGYFSRWIFVLIFLRWWFAGIKICGRSWNWKLLYKRPRIFREISHTSNRDSANSGIGRGLKVLEVEIWFYYNINIIPRQKEKRNRTRGCAALSQSVTLLARAEIHM